MGLTLAQFTEKLVSISEFSQGKAGKIFADVAGNNNEYIVLKNNQPTAVVLSVNDYRNMQEKAAQFDRMMAYLQSYRNSNQGNSSMNESQTEFSDLVAESRLTEEELEALAQCMEME